MMVKDHSSMVIQMSNEFIWIALCGEQNSKLSFEKITLTVSLDRGFWKEDIFLVSKLYYDENYKTVAFNTFLE